MTSHMSNDLKSALIGLLFTGMGYVFRLCPFLSDFMMKHISHTSIFSKSTDETYT